MKPVILLNAPPNSGKDVIAKRIVEITGLPHLEFKTKLFQLALVISGLYQEEWDEIYTRELKEVPDERLWGMSPRAFLITISEDMIKPHCGQNYFGEYLGNTASKHGGVVSDSGFNKEAESVVDICGEDNVFIVRFTREGCSFDGDSRNFVTTNKVKNYLDLENNGTIDEIVEKILCWVDSFYKDSQLLEYRSYTFS